MSCSVAFSVVALICSDFISVLLVRGFGSLTRSRGTKEPRLQENGRRQFQREATGVPRVCEWRAGVPGRLVDAPGQTDLVSLASGQIAQSLKILQLEPKADA